MKKNILETAIGFIVIITAIFFLAFVYNNSYKDKGQSYLIKAKFQNADGIINGSDIKIAGINVGSVDDMSLDNSTYEAILTLSINEKVQIPVDSRASIVSSGFVGNKFISIDPGSDEMMIQKGGNIMYTNSALNLETLIGKFMYSFGNKSDK